eukprot:1612096-Amphidinium_carterae.1
MAGGPSMYDEHLNCVERFDPDTAQWEVVASMVSTRSSAAAVEASAQDTVALGDALYVYGGISDEGLLPSAERYSISSRCWEELPAMSRNREYAACNIIMHCDTPGQVPLCADTCRNTSIQHAMRNPLHIAQRIMHATRLTASFMYFVMLQAFSAVLQRLVVDTGLAAANGCLYVCGGQDKGEVLRSVERFKAETFAWEPVSSMQQARCNAATVSVNGYLYVYSSAEGMRFRKHRSSSSSFSPSGLTLASTLFKFVGENQGKTRDAVPLHGSCPPQNSSSNGRCKFASELHKVSCTTNK